MRRLLGSAFGAISALRVEAYRRGLLRRHRLQGPVVSVGNLGVGGSGKTPVVERLARILLEAGEPVAILSRGYGGRFAGASLVVSDGARVLACAAAAGDEPVMLARALPGVVVAVGARRDAVGRDVEARFGRRVHLLDDGFQHLRLARDLDLVCVDALDAGGRPIPAGRLREFPTAISRADAVLLTQADAATADTLRVLEARFGEGRTFRFTRRILGYFGLDGTPRTPPARAFLLAGIARPERLAADVSARGATIVGRRFFRDHHVFSAQDLAAAAEQARAAGADAIVTTAKDAVRLPAGATDPPTLVLRIAAEIGDERRFRERLLAVARRVSA